METPPAISSSVTLRRNGSLAVLSKLDWDSKFFGFGMGRLEPFAVSGAGGTSAPDGAAFVYECLERACAMGIEQLCVEVDEEDMLSIHALEAAHFRRLTTVLTYRLATRATTCAQPDPDVHPATLDDLPTLEEVARRCFGDRTQNRNRFNCDARFSRNDVERLYAAAVRNALLGTRADAVLTIHAAGHLAGFAAVRLPAGTRCGSIPINAVHPDWQRRRFYSRLLAATLCWFSERAVETVEIRSEARNLPVHRAWQRLGARRVRTQHTYHRDIT